MNAIFTEIKKKNVIFFFKRCILSVPLLNQIKNELYRTNHGSIGRPILYQCSG
jgi:hypothetical protein